MAITQLIMMGIIPFSAAAPAVDALLMETGDYLLLEIGDRISLE